MRCSWLVVPAGLVGYGFVESFAHKVFPIFCCNSLDSILKISSVESIAFISQKTNPNVSENKWRICPD